MARIEAKLAKMGLPLPRALQMPVNIQMSLPFAWVRVRGTRAFVSGHVPLNPDGTIAKPVGKVGAEVSPDEGYAAAKLVALAQLASLRTALGDLDRITAWLRIFAMVNVAPGFDQMPRIANGFSDLILELYGPDIGTHARSAVGVALPLNVPVECEAEVEVDGQTS
ncbi:RidA family protein [Paraburkholderia sp. PGU16]|jgi:enamine deaminase RidA (YjgF/YER057c/UK114 family)|uniref:LysR family transcriptional regulator n=1 Tax=Paraburkholderia largidicola TaxID=3014751 RepID=A0A7I8BYE8_9BURK|nr:RidA family protein [Paraburkholderia sp. PGU16]BCF93415.1 LysR family transcriptional regulator [Paraburkholderia sp. PGU16]BEU26593.1 RidA family protein [Paraburkholderia sp. 22B1P]